MIIRSEHIRSRASCLLVAVLAALTAPAGAAAAPYDRSPSERSIDAVTQRLEALELQNRELATQVAELRRQNEVLQSSNAAPAAAASAGAAPRPTVNSADGHPQIRFTGDFRFRHEDIDNGLMADNRTRETIRARLAAAIKLNELLGGEIGVASGGLDPRGASSTLGATSSRKEIGLDLAYLSWRPIKELALFAGKMRQPFVRPGPSMFIDNEIRPEGIAATYKAANGLFGSAFQYWLEERAVQADSTVTGGQLGWDGAFSGVKVKFGAGYYDYGSVQGRFPGFGNGLLNELGNTIVGSGSSATYLYDYNIAQVFAETTLMLGELPLNLYADYGRNSAADNGLDTAYDFGLLVGKASSPGKWEAGVLTQRVEKDALFGQWTDSDFAGGVTDNEGHVYRIAWMAPNSLLINLTWLDTAFNVDVGQKANYDRWQLDFNFLF